MAYGVLVITDMSKYKNYTAIFLHKAVNAQDILVYNPDITTYYTFNTQQDAQTWFSQWYYFNHVAVRLPADNFSITEIQPGINTQGYIPVYNNLETKIEFSV